MSKVGTLSWVSVVLLAGVLAGAYVAASKGHFKQITFKSQLMPIKFVHIGGIFQYLSESDLKATLLPLVDKSIFQADMQTIHAAVAALPWVDTVSVKRIWPDAVDIKITERRPYARWGENSLITQNGVIFIPQNTVPFQHLVRVSGPEMQHLKVLEIMKGVKTALADQSLTLAEFGINSRGAWKIKLADGLEILLGREEQLKKLQRFLKALSVLKPEQTGLMAVVDLRYPNGYAVSWKPGSPEIDWAALAAPTLTTQEHEKAKQSR